MPQAHTHTLTRPLTRTPVENAERAAARRACIQIYTNIRLVFQIYVTNPAVVLPGKRMMRKV